MRNPIAEAYTPEEEAKDTTLQSHNRRKRANNRGRTHRLFGFLLGATGAGAAMYTYVVQEYKVGNELLTEDIYVRLDGGNLL
jgi:hypothetical protein